MEKVLRFCVDRGHSTIVLFTIDTSDFISFVDSRSAAQKLGKSLGC